MSYEKEIAFFRSILSNLMIQTQRFSPNHVPVSDRGLRRILGLPLPMDSGFPMAEERTVYHAADHFGCSYNWLILPHTGEVLLVGPYFLKEHTDTELMSLLEVFHLSPQLLSPLKNYFSTIPVLQQDNLMIMTLTALAEAIWGSKDNFRIRHITLAPLSSADLPKTDRSAHFEAMNIKLIEERYESERALTNAVTQGKTRHAVHLISRAQENLLEQRSADHVRNFQNYGIVLNTLLRKAAEAGGVHPLHIDRLSSAHAKALEKCLTSADVYAQFLRMVEDYCELVRTHSLRDYSPLVRQVILRIESDLTADLSLHAHADALHVNASYLSSQFHQETGMTLTEYVNKKRVELASTLLLNTKMQVQTIAQYCGITDVNYFTKLFRKRTGLTPSAYRAEKQGG